MTGAIPLAPTPPPLPFPPPPRGDVFAGRSAAERRPCPRGPRARIRTRRQQLVDVVAPRRYAERERAVRVRRAHVVRRIADHDHPRPVPPSRSRSIPCAMTTFRSSESSPNPPAIDGK